MDNKDIWAEIERRAHEDTVDRTADLLAVFVAGGDVEELRRKHLDINVLVREALDAFPVDLHGGDRIRQGGLDGLARANRLSSKTGSGVRAPEMLREGRTEEVLDYCETDVRLVAALYRIAAETERLFVDAYAKRDSERVELGRLEVPMKLGEKRGDSGR